MAQLPAHFSPQKGEEVVALIPQDRQVGFLLEAFLSVLGLLVLSGVFIGFDLLRGVTPTPPSGSTLASLAFLLGPVVLGRFLRRPGVYVLTDRRLVLAEDHEIALHDITRLRVWTTRVAIHTGRVRHMLLDLINPGAVAGLIRDTIARNGATQ